MSSILVDNLTGKTTAGSVTVKSEGGGATMQLQQGLVKGWIRFTGVTTTAALDSFNMSVTTDAGTGDTRISFTNSMNSANYSATMYTNHDATTGVSAFDADISGRGLGLVGRATGTIQHFSFQIDSAVNDVQIAGDLA